MSNGFANPRETWDARFDRDDYIFGTAPNAFLAAQRARLAPGQRALAVADGEGRNSVWLAQQGLVATAFDIAPRGVAKARALAARAGVTVDLHVAAVEQWDWTPAAYDVVVAIFVQFAAPPVRERMFAGMLATLRPGGLLVIAHQMGREALDRLHNQGGDVIQSDLLPERAALAGLLADAGFSDVEILDEPDQYIAWARA